MSWQAVEWAIESGQKQPELGVLVALAYHANHEGENAYPSISTLQRESGVSRRSVFRSLKRLRAEGLVSVSGKSAAGTRVYRILMRGHGVTESRVSQSHGVREAPVRDRHLGGAPVAPKQSLTVSSNNPPVVPPEVTALNGRTSEVVERFKLVARERKGKTLKVDVPRLLRVLEDHAHLPSLYDESIKCAEWLGSERGRGRTDAPRTLRNWLDGKVKEQPKSQSSDDWRQQWTAFAERKRQEQAAA